MASTLDPITARIATELFYTTAAPTLVREVAGVLGSSGIPIMPLKGTLLQRLVYGMRSFRPISDVDVLVPPARFGAARSALRAAGFTVEREEQGGWEVALRRPEGLLEVDLHRRLSSTVRSALLPDDLFRRGRRDTALFGVPVVIPDGRDLYAHLLLHLTLSWLALGRLHHPEDFEAVPAALSLSPDGLAGHLAEVGLRRHALLVLPLIASATRGSFTSLLIDVLGSTREERLIVDLVRRTCARAAPGSLPRRIAGFCLAPSWTEAARDAVEKRLSRGA
jgi:putative nucleotidyltransferase-like protein